jgi:hypothetical protein
LLQASKEVENIMQKLTVLSNETRQALLSSLLKKFLETMTEIHSVAVTLVNQFENFIVILNMVGDTETHDELLLAAIGKTIVEKIADLAKTINFDKYVKVLESLQREAQDLKNLLSNRLLELLDKVKEQSTKVELIIVDLKHSFVGGVKNDVIALNTSVDKSKAANSFVNIYNICPSAKGYLHCFIDNMKLPSSQIHAQKVVDSTKNAKQLVLAAHEDSDFVFVPIAEEPRW